MHKAIFTEAAPRSREFYVPFLGHLTGKLEDHLRASEDTLKEILAIARRTPALARYNGQLAGIMSVDDLFRSGFFMSPDEELPKMGDEVNWPERMGAEVRYVSWTSGSSGRPKEMPATEHSLKRQAMAFGAFIVPQLIALMDKGVESPNILGLTGTPGMVTYNCIPALSNWLGANAYTVPLSFVLRSDEVAEDLVHIMNQKDIHGIFTLPTMMPPFINRLKSIPGGERAVERLQETCQFGGTTWCLLQATALQT